MVKNWRQKCTCNYRLIYHCRKFHRNFTQISEGGCENFTQISRTCLHLHGWGKTQISPAFHARIRTPKDLPKTISHHPQKSPKPAFHHQQNLGNHVFHALDLRSMARCRSEGVWGGGDQACGGRGGGEAGAASLCEPKCDCPETLLEELSKSDCEISQDSPG